MSLSGHVHWHEGLFLQPHHLQSMQRRLLEHISSERRLAFAYPYGVIEARLSPGALENFRVQFDVLRLVLPGGLEVNVPENADVPPLDIQAAFQSTSGSFSVSIGAPHYSTSRPNTLERGSDDVRAKRLYKVVDEAPMDENTGDNPQTVPVRRLNLRLMLESDDPTDMLTMPLLRIMRPTADETALPRQDADFVAPTLLLSGSPILRDIVRDIANQVEATRKELIITMTRGGFSTDAMRGPQFEQMLRLRTLNRFAASLPSLAQAPVVTPFALYLQMRELLGELAALVPATDPFEISLYDHDNPIIAFRELQQKIPPALRFGSGGVVLKAPFVREGKIHVTKLTDEQLTQPNEYFIGIKSKTDPRAVVKLVEDADKFQLMAVTLKDQRVFGVKLGEERHPPVQLPSETGLTYFRLDRAAGPSALMWNRIKKEKACACRWPDVDTSDFAITLYMTVPGA